ncbi:DNA methyltransferase [Candidatus Poriferisocius sp.]|uniref:DNA methyltransferase n=1 Tax=Candidatus Poriferisocius sp. TaxID=3101276 RepID=UPI003B01E1BE
MNSESVDLIYLDPPFNSKTNYAAPIGSAAAGAAFKDTWTLSDLDTEWIDLMEHQHSVLWRVLLAAMTDSDKSYLAYMSIRLMEMHRILKPTGLLYLHCDPTMSHYLKLVLDAIFGRSQFRNEIVWCYSGGGMSRNNFPRKHDIIFRYAKQDATITYNVERKPYKENTQQVGKHSTYSGGHDIDLERGTPITDWWTDIKTVTGWSSERTGYPTQKPLALLQRIVKTSSNPGDVVLDPFCGCATALVAADDLGRNWVGIDISGKAAELVVQRIEERQGLFRNIIHRRDIPDRTDLGPLPRYNSPENRTQLYGQQGGHCAACDEHFQSRHLEVDHIIARNKGGTDHISNLQLLCGHCNRVKGDRGMAYLREKLQLAA